MRKFDLISRPYDDMYDLMNRFFNRGLPASKTFADFKIDVQDKEGEYVVEADLPGFSKEEIQLELNDDYLQIAVQKTESKEEDNHKNYVHKERYYSAMSRSVYLPNAAKEGVKAKIDNGVLTIIIPKNIKSAEVKRISIE